MTDTQITFIRGLKAKDLAPTFLDLFNLGKVERSDWMEWNKVWFEGQRTQLFAANTRLQHEAEGVFDIEP